MFYAAKNPRKSALFVDATPAFPAQIRKIGIFVPNPL
jgi:hypothetical protein